MAERGISLLRNPRLNRSTLFGEAERETLGLHGLLPDSVDTPDIQMQRVLEQLARQPSALDKYLHLSVLQDTDESLFYRILMADPTRMMPLIYTPTVGDACLAFSHIFQRPRGLYLSLRRKGTLRALLRNWPERDVRFIVVTSGERILGLGDLGANGMGIPIGKLVLYTACARVPPAVTMPVTIDCGTDNETLLGDPLYLGLRQKRCSVAELDELVDEFVTAVQAEFPHCCIQFEDWGRADALRLLTRYRDRLCCFNDDIQGSGAAVVAGIRNALKISGGMIADQTFLFLGAGAAAYGIAHLLTKAMEREGLTTAQAQQHIWLFNRGGLIESTRSDLLTFQQAYAHPHPVSTSFHDALQSVRPTVLVGQHGCQSF